MLLFEIFKTQLRTVAKVILLAIVVYVIGSVPPILLGRLVDDTLGSGSVDQKLYVLIFLLAFGSFGVEMMLSSFLTRFSGSMIKKQYIESVTSILRKERSVFEKIKIGEIIDVFSRYINSYETLFSTFLSSFVPSIFAIAVLLGAVFYVSNFYVFLTVLFLQSAIFIFSLVFLKRYGEHLKAYTKACYELSDEWVEILGNNKIVQNEFSFSMAIKRLEKFVCKMVVSFMKRTKSQNTFRSSINFGQTLSLLLVLLVLLQFLPEGQLSVGAILAVLAFNNMLLSHVQVSSEFLLKMKNYEGYFKDFERISSYDSYLNEGRGEVGKFEEIVVKPISIEKNDKVIFATKEELSFARGEKICVLGVSGSGKTTFFSLFFNANKPYQETVYINGRPAFDINSESYQKSVRISFQENEIMSGQGYDTLFQRSIDPDYAYSLLSELELPEDIAAGKRQLEPWAGNISGGEAKRLNVARLLGQPGEINILDEPTTGLNVSLSRKTWECILRCAEGSTLFCSTHDLTYIDKFDRVLIIDAGKIVADLKPEELNENPHFEKIRDKL